MADFPYRKEYSKEIHGIAIILAGFADRLEAPDPEVGGLTLLFLAQHLHTLADALAAGSPPPALDGA